MNDDIRYLTVKKNILHELVIEKSRFICHICRTPTEQQARSFIADIKKRYWDATHNCSAYIIGERFQAQRSSDDGEPSGTAGIPMLEVLKKRGLTDTTVVVTRYFGGIKLGTGGLIRAYGKSVSEALGDAGITAVVERTVLKVETDYRILKKVDSQIIKTPYILTGCEYTATVTFFVSCCPAEKQALETWLLHISGGNAAFLSCETSLVECDYLSKI